MRLSEFIYHLAHKSIKIRLICYDYKINCFITLFNGTMGELLNWVKYPSYMDFLVENVCPEDSNSFEVKIYG